MNIKNIFYNKEVGFYHNTIVKSSKLKTDKDYHFWNPSCIVYNKKDLATLKHYCISHQCPPFAYTNGNWCALDCSYLSWTLQLHIHLYRFFLSKILFFYNCSHLRRRTTAVHRLFRRFRYTQCVTTSNTLKFIIK